ncbi:MAG: nucleotide exchange factor GrpE [Proteobacteria bacterium]|nr:nucleotide exchange factor GrpE [Pseudomonadota bacterium]MBU1709609.1 nucleotide exchange factor GrpE [Pseudomonadota bacterium]
MDDEAIDSSDEVKQEGDGFSEAEQAGDDERLSPLEAAQEQARENHDKMLRMAAEFENSKKRLIREREAAVKYAEEYILKELLPTIDNLQRAMEQGQKTNEASALLEGVEMTFKGMIATLERFGLKPIVGKGELFDPNFHEALAMEASSEVPENVILQEYEKGYMFKDRLLRATKVVVSKGDKTD